MGAYSEKLRHRFMGGPKPATTGRSTSYRTFPRHNTVSEEAQALIAGVGAMEEDYSRVEARIKAYEEGREFIAEDKGLKDGSCNLTACQRPNSAVYFNKSTRKYYCVDCAEGINWLGGRAMTLELYGVPLLCEHYDSPTAYLNMGDWRDGL